MRVLFFSHKVSGHFLEYIHHIYEAASKDMVNQYTILIPSAFENVKNLFSWNNAGNISIIYLTKEEEKLIAGNSLIKNAWRMSKIVKRYTRELKIEKIFLLWFIGLMPFLPMLLPKRVKISGILYRIHLYKRKEQSRLRNLIENVRMHFIISRPNVDAVYVLNDDKSVTMLNDIYHVSKFKYLPDPVPSIDKLNLKNIRKELKISDNKTVFLHFGAMDERKGTLSILEAIIKCPNTSLKNLAFIFAGKIDVSIKACFYERFKEAKQKCDIKVFDEFCENEFLYNLCYSCDYILIPYSNTCQSSGVIGYASFFEKPVIGPSDGLLGNLIRENQLGIALDEVDSSSLSHQLQKNQKLTCKSSYSKAHTVEKFVEAIFV